VKPLTCAAARRRLQAFHDRELSIADQIAVGAHVEWCGPCAATLADLRLVSAALRATTTGRRVLSRDEVTGFQMTVVNRARAERDASFMAGVRSMFDDMHLVYAGFGAAVATVLCVAVMLGMMRFASRERPDSLAAMVAFLTIPGSTADAIVIDPASQARWTARFQAANESAEQDAVFALAAVLTRDPRVGHLDRFGGRNASGLHAVSTEDAKLIETLMDEVSRARFDAVNSDAISATNMVWIVTHTTVRATNAAPGVDLPLPAAKKRASLPTARASVV